MNERALEARSHGGDLTGRPSGEIGQFDRSDHYEDYGEDDGLDLAWVWRTLWARKYWLLAAAIAGLAAALAISLLQTPLYRSTATLELNPPTVPILANGGDDSGETMVVPQTDWQFLATQLGLLKSRDLALRVVEELNLAGQNEGDGQQNSAETQKNLAASLASGIQVTPVGDSRLVELSYLSPEPSEAARIVNAYADTFLQSSLDRRFEATAAARNFLQQRLQTVREDVRSAEAKLVAYAKANNIIETGGEESTGSLTGDSLTSLNTALAAAQEKRITAEQRFRQGSNITETNRSTIQLRQEKARLEAEYQEKANTFQDNYPDMVRLRSRIDELGRAISSETSRSTGSLRAEYRAALAEENALRARVAQLSANVLNERERSIQYNTLKRELDTSRALYDALLERNNELGVASGIGTAQAAVVDRGEVPQAPASPNVPRNLILGLILGLGLGAGIALLYERLTDKIKTPDDVRDKLRLPLLGVIPEKDKKLELSHQLSDPKAALAEAYMSLLTTLQFSTSDGVPKSIVVTSCREAEGKTTTAYVLATYLAKLGRKVLLVDGDMRKPSFIVEERADIGLSRLLVNTETPLRHILETKADRLWLMPSGPVPPNPSQLLNSERLDSIVKELEATFDVVIIDAPPTLGFADAPLLSTACKGTVFVIESGKTRSRQALEVVSRIYNTGGFILGAALTKYRTTAGEYGYGYGYYENYAQDPEKIESHELSPELIDRR